MPDRSDCRLLVLHVLHVGGPSSPHYTLCKFIPLLYIIILSRWAPLFGAQRSVLVYHESYTGYISLLVHAFYHPLLTEGYSIDRTAVALECLFPGPRSDIPESQRVLLSETDARTLPSGELQQ
jgi:hypothetical protein